MNQPPTWAARSLPEGGDPGPVTPKNDEPKRSLLLPVLGAGALALLVGAAGFAIGRGDNGNDAAATGDEITTTSDSSATPATTTTTASPTTTEAPTTTQAPTTTEAPTTTQAPTTLPDAADEAGAQEVDTERRAVLKGGKLYLRGRIPSEEIAAAIVERAAAVVGADNVVDEYVIDPAAAFPESAPLYVEDLVLFAYGSDQINPAFVPLLDLGTALLSQNPQVIITIVSHTDADGSEEFNLDLSERRGAAVKKYWTDLGIDPDQIVIEARGESSPIGDNDTDEGAQLNRRAEFVIANLLG